MSLTVADVRRRARQSTCHATPGSFELIAGTAGLSPPPLAPSSPGPLISSLLSSPQPPTHRRSPRSFFSRSSSVRRAVLLTVPRLPPRSFLLGRQERFATYRRRFVIPAETREPRLRAASGTVPMHLVSLCSLDSVPPSASFASHGNASWEVTEKEVTLIRYPSSPPRSIEIPRRLLLRITTDSPSAAAFSRTRRAIGENVRLSRIARSREDRPASIQRASLRARFEETLV